MSALITTVPSEPFGAAAATLPRLLPSVGAFDYVHRWSTLSIDGAVANGVPVLEWVSTRGQVMRAGSAGSAPILATSAGGVRALQFDGVDDFLEVSGLGQMVTVVIVARVTAAAGVSAGVWDDGTADFKGVSRPASGSLGLFGPGPVTMAGAEASSWSYIAAWFGSSSVLRLNAATSGPATANSTKATGMRFGRHNTVFGKVEVAEVLMWDRILSVAEHNSVRASLKSYYTAMV